MPTEAISVSKAAYNIASAAKATSTSEATISEAIRTEQLEARVAGTYTIVTGKALKKWANSLLLFRP